MSDGQFARDAWTAAIELLRAEGRLSDSQTAFVRLAQPLAVLDDTFYVGVSSEFTRNLIASSAGDLLIEQLSAIFGRHLNLDISVDPALSEHPVQQQVPPHTPTWSPSGVSDRTGREFSEDTGRTLRPVPPASSYEPVYEPSYDTPVYEPASYEKPAFEDKPQPVRSVPAPTKSYQPPQFHSQPNQVEARLNPRYTFENFVTGESNRFAHATALAVAEIPGSTYNPLFLYSDSGMGKTHLLHAIGNSVQEMYVDKKVLYVSAEEFTNAFINALAEGQMHTFKDQFRNVDVLLIDDIQFLSGRDRSRTLEEFFHTFNALINANKQIVITSDVAPNLLVDFEDRMISRFNSGITAAIDLPNLETRIAILNRKAAAENMNVPLEVTEFIASRMTTNVREMEGAFRRVRAFADLTKQEITLDLAESQLKDMISDPSSIQITAGLINAQVASYFNIPVADLKSPTRTRTLTTPRHIAMYLCREMTDLSLPKIAEVFDRRDHTTVLNALRKVERLMAEKQTMFNQVSDLTAQIKNAAKEQAQMNM
ncbi:MAG: chromosomal replication initiator protein DnaA [Arcanobacterium sp.]